MYNQKPLPGDLLDYGNSLSQGLVGLWPFSEDNSSDKVFDLSGNGRHGIAVGATNEITWQSGPDGSCVDFVGNTQAGFQFPTITLAADTYWTIVVRCKLDGDALEGGLLGTYASSNDYLLWSEGNYLRFKNSAGSSTDFAVSSFTNWATYAFTAEGPDDKLNLYIDGVFSEQKSIITSLIIDNIGSSVSFDAYATDGKVSYVNIYNRALNPSEIAKVNRTLLCMVRTKRRRIIYDEIAGVPPTTFPYYYREIASRRIA